MNCSAERAGMSLLWLKDGVPAARELVSRVQQINRSQDNTSSSLLSISSLTKEHSGAWTCLAITPRGNNTRTVNVLVVSNRAAYCPPVTTSDNKVRRREHVQRANETLARTELAGARLRRVVRVSGRDFTSSRRGALSLIARALLQAAVSVCLATVYLP